MGKVRCQLCGKEVEPRGLGGHIWGVHGIRVGSKEEIKRLITRLSMADIRFAKIKNLVERGIEDVRSGKSNESMLLEILRIAEMALYGEQHQKTQSPSPELKDLRKEQELKA